MESDQRPKRCLANMTDNAVKNQFSVLRKRIVQQESSNKENNAPDVNTGSQYRLVHHTESIAWTVIIGLKEIKMSFVERNMANFVVLYAGFVGVQVQCTKDLQQNGRFHYHHLLMETEFLIRRSLRTLILLRALNVTIEDICGALLEGRSDTLGTELLENPFVIEASSSNAEYRRSNSVFNEVDTKMYNDLGDCNKITTVKSTKICSHQEDWESRRARMKMTKGFIAEESVKGHIDTLYDAGACENAICNDPSASSPGKGGCCFLCYDDGLESLPNRKWISDKRTKNQAKTDKTEHKMEKRGKAKVKSKLMSKKVKVNGGKVWQNKPSKVYYILQYKVLVVDSNFGGWQIMPPSKYIGSFAKFVLKGTNGGRKMGYGS
ncbi:hypothetical protein Tco_1132675 [Tanacetum coccineum]|uniref:Uncharacterized protein n=1 Tax=Tanacetum coccineum TaxID=301880 RepID=A0ABQ5JD92_9ASTR